MYIRYQIKDINYNEIAKCATTAPIGLEHIKAGALVVGTYGRSTPCIGAGYLKGIVRASDGELVAEIESIELDCSLSTLHNVKLVEIPPAFHRAGLPIVVAHQDTGVVIADDGEMKRITNAKEVWYASDTDICTLTPFLKEESNGYCRC